MSRASIFVAGRGRCCVGALVLVVLWPRGAWAQFNQMPEPGYYAAVNEFYAGEYRNAEKAFRRLGRAGVQSAQARWIDSICYHAMLGEVIYHQGRNAEALAEFDQACQLLLTYPEFLQQVQFDDPRPDPNTARQQVPWGASNRPIVLGNYPRTMQIMMGELNAAQNTIQRGGGAVMQAQIWRVNVIEIIRTSALAIRRRNEILGPLGKYDRISKELAAVLARGNLAPLNHWSNAWMELLAGVAKAGIGSGDEARTHLNRAVIVGGQLDHPLTGVALLELGRLAMAAGDHRTAAGLLADASVSAFYYDDPDVVTESLRLGWINHLAGGADGLYAPLDAAAAWAQANRLWHVAATLRLAQCENLVRLGRLPDAAARLDETARRIGDMRNARLGIKLVFLQAVVQLGQGQFDSGSTLLNRALAAQALASLRNFQIQRAAELYDQGVLLPRVAPDVFKSLLDDPSPADWAQRTLDTLAVMTTPHDEAFDRWFLAAWDRKDTPLALEVAERAKRSRFLSTLPLGGRLLALRAVLEAPAGELSTAAALERQQLAANSPAYRDLSAAAAGLYQQIRSGPLQAEPGAAGPSLNDRLAQWNENVAAREQMLLSMALSPVPSTFLFPPLRTTAELKQALAPGEALVVFHAAGGNLFGFLVSRQNQNVWQLGDERQVERALAEWLRALGNYSATREIAGEELNKGDWRAAAAKMYQALFAGARLDLAKTTDLAIVPDSWLWYLPFEALIPPGKRGETAMLVDRVPIHYGPTAALAVGDTRPFRRVRHTGIVANELGAAEKNAGERGDAHTAGRRGGGPAAAGAAARAARLSARSAVGRTDRAGRRRVQSQRSVRLVAVSAGARTKR